MIGVPHDLWQEVPKAFVIKREESAITEQELIQFVNSQVAHFKHLQGGLVFLKNFPRTTIGKIDRKTLKAQQVGK